MTICLWPGCEREAIRRGYCHRDSSRLWRQGLLLKVERLPARPRVLRRLQPDEALPATTPTRTVNDQGYVLLRWHVGPSEWVEEREHRVVAGRPAKHLEVHHLNGARSDNRPENLQILTRSQHAAVHGGLLHLQAVAGRTRVTTPALRDHDVVIAAVEASWAAIAAAYRAGASMVDLASRFGLDESNISRGLRSRRVPVRTPDRNRAGVDEAMVLADLRRGVRADRIADAHGVTAIVIHRIRRAHGIPPQPPGRPPANAALPTVLGRPLGTVPWVEPT